MTRAERVEKAKYLYRHFMALYNIKTLDSRPCAMDDRIALLKICLRCREIFKPEKTPYVRSIGQ